MVGWYTFSTTSHGLPATRSFVFVFNVSGPVKVLASGAGPGQIGSCFSPDGGCQTFVSSCRSANAHATLKVTSKGIATRIGLTRVRQHFVIYFCLHRGSLPQNTAI